jgi:hypothetical protein
MSNESDNMTCKFCSEQGDLLILPLRYAVVCDENPATIAPLPAISGTLGDSFATGVALSDKAKYAARPLRSGFLYVLLERSGVKNWQAYCVTKEACLYSFPPNNPPTVQPEFLCNVAGHCVNASMIKIDKASKVQKAYLLFTPDPLTSRKLKFISDYVGQYVTLGAIQEFSPSDWVKGQHAQPHSLQAEQLDAQVAEVLAENNNPLTRALNSSLFPPYAEPFDPIKPSEDIKKHAEHLKNLKAKLEQVKSPAFVLYDAIGITQELNAFRNAPLEPVQFWLQKKEDKKISNEHKLHILGAYEDVRKMAHIVFNNQDWVKKYRLKTDEMIKTEKTRTARALKVKRFFGFSDLSDVEIDDKAKKAEQELPGWIEEMWREKEDEIFNRRYAGRLIDIKGMEKFRTTLETITANARKVVNTRYKDHLEWIQSFSMRSALSVYDVDDEQSGMRYSNQIGMAMIGMDFTPEGDELAKKWAKDFSISDDNLLWCGFCHNMTAIKEAMRIALKEVQKNMPDNPDKMGEYINRELYGIDPANLPKDRDSWLKTTNGVLKDVIKLMDKVTKVNGELNEGTKEKPRINNKQWLKNKFYGKHVGLLALLTNKTMGFAMTKLERNIAKALFPMLATPLGKWACSVDHEGKLGKFIQSTSFKPANIAHMELEEGRKRWAANTKADGDYMRLRLAPIIFGIEAINLIFRAAKENKDSRDYWLLGAAILATAGSTVEVYAYLFRTISRSGIDPVMLKGAAVGYGGIKLIAGSLASFAGGIGAVLDFSGFSEAKANGNHRLATILFTRASLQSISLGAGALTAFADAAAWFGHRAMLAKAGSTSAKAFTTLEGAAKAANNIKPIVYRFGCFAAEATLWLTLLLLIGPVVYDMVTDDELEAWCRKSCFGKGAEAGGFANAEAEAQVLYKSFEAVAPVFLDTYEPDVYGLDVHNY